MNLLGRCHEEGWGCPKDADQARHWYRRSAEAGYFRAQFNHALALLQTLDYAGAAQWLKRAAQGGDAAMRRAIMSLLRDVRDPTLQSVAAEVRAP